MQIDLGSAVFTNDGSRVGTVDKIILDAESRAILSIVVKSGTITRHHRIADISMIRSEDATGLTLSVSEDQYDDLPDFIEHQYVTVPREDIDAVPFIIPNAGGGGGYLYGAPNIGRGYEGRQDSFFDSAPTRETIVENRSNIDAVDIAVSKGTDVVDNAGHKIGNVHEVLYDAADRLEGLLVVAGSMMSHETLRIPLEWIETTGEDQIRLNIAADDVEARGHVDESNAL